MDERIEICSILEISERRRSIEYKSTCSRSGGKYNCFCDDSSGERKIPCHFQADPCKEGTKGRTGGGCREGRPGQVQDGNDGRGVLWERLQKLCLSSEYAFRSETAGAGSGSQWF